MGAGLFLLWVEPSMSQNGVHSLKLWGPKKSFFQAKHGTFASFGMTDGPEFKYISVY